MALGQIINGSLAVSYVEFKGLLHALDPRQVEAPFVIAGENFRMTTEGPQAYFGARALSRLDLVYRKNVDSFVINNEVYFTFPGAIMQYDYISAQFLGIFDFQEIWTDNETHPWTHGECGGKHYFYHPNMGQRIIQFDPLVNAWVHYTTSFFPKNMRCITDAIGRLVVLGKGTVGWSALDNGADFDYTGSSGAGYQGLSIIGGTALMVAGLRDGFIVYTTAGAIRASYANITAIFRFQELTRAMSLVSPFAFVNDDGNTHILLTAAGLFVTDGAALTAFRPLFNEYYKQTAARLYRGRAALKYCAATETIYVLLREDDSISYYSMAFALSKTLDKWGKVTRLFVNFLYVPNLDDSRQMPALGYYSPEGLMYMFDGRCRTQIPQAGHLVDIDMTSFIFLGLFRFTTGLASDELSMVTNMAIGYGFGDVEYLEIDYNTATGEDNYNTSSGFETWGVDYSEKPEFTIELYKSFDGRITGTPEIPALFKDTGYQKFYTTAAVGMYYIIKIMATGPQETYHIKLLELTGNPAGRL